MKKLILLITLLFTANSFAGTCTSISRTNVGANSVLTSTKYNADLNTTYSNSNAYDLGCGTDGTLEGGALNTTDFAVPLSAIQQGCKAVYSDSNTLNIEKCFGSVNGEWVKTTSNTSVTWGCTDCVSETASASFYLYMKDGSTGSTLTPLISSTSPNSNGYDASNNKVVARFYNGASGAIDQYSIDQWIANKFISNNTDWVVHTPTYQGFGSPVLSFFKWRRVGNSMNVITKFTSGTMSAAEARVSTPGDRVIDVSRLPEFGLVGHVQTDTDNANTSVVLGTGGDAYFTFAYNTLEERLGNAIFNSGSVITFFATVPILGWGD